MRRPVKYLLILLAALLLNPVRAFHARAQDDVDYKAYSLFVYNFIKYIEWPNLDAEFRIGVMGDSPVLKELQNLAKAKKAKGKPIVIKVISSPEEALGCHLVYISSSKSSTLKALLEKTKGKPVLLVGEREGLAKKGAGLSFITMDDDVLKFEFNKTAIESNQLKIPSALTNLGLPI